jgi:hypothetical protein
MKAVFELPHRLGTVVFPKDSAVPTTPTALADVQSRLLAAFPSVAFTLVTYFSPTGDADVGTTAIRDARRAAVRAATTTAEGRAPKSVASASVEVPQAAFDVARANGVTQAAVMVVDIVPPPIVETVDPDNGRAGDQFTIFGANLVLNPDDDVVVLFAGPTEPGAEPPHRCEVVQPTMPNAVTARVPDVSSTTGREDFTVILSRSDGAEVVAIEDFSLAIL